MQEIEVVIDGKTVSKKNIYNKELIYPMNNRHTKQILENFSKVYYPKATTGVIQSKPEIAEHFRRMATTNPFTENIEKKEVKSMEIVKIYFERKREELIKKYDEKIDTLISSDANVTMLNNVLDKIKANLRKEEKYIDLCFVKIDVINDETLEKINKLKEEREKEIKELRAKRTEVNAFLQDAETYEQKMKILSAYGIIDKNGKLAE